VSAAAQIRIEGLYNVEGVGTVYAGTGKHACIS
jgi:GTPase